MTTPRIIYGVPAHLTEARAARYVAEMRALIVLMTRCFARCGHRVAPHRGEMRDTCDACSATAPPRPPAPVDMDRKTLILGAIHILIDRLGRSPSLVEIGAEVGLSDDSTCRYVQALERDGLIRRGPRHGQQVRELVPTTVGTVAA